MTSLASTTLSVYFFFFQAEDGIRDLTVTGVQTCALPISTGTGAASGGSEGSTNRSDGSGRQTQHQFLWSSNDVARPLELVTGQLGLREAADDEGQGDLQLE